MPASNKEIVTSMEVSGQAEEQGGGEGGGEGGG